MSRTKPEPIETIDQANDLLFELALTQLELQKIDNKAAEQIALVQKEAELNGKDHRDRIAGLEARLLGFAELKKDELFPEDGKKRSVEVTFGTFGYRRSQSIVIENESKTIELIESTKKNLASKLGLSSAIERTPKIKKNSLRSFNEETLEKFGIVRKYEDTFFVDTDTEAVNLQLQKAKPA
ncbi:MAG TPA: host-nuclease inhibitor Gam family protein [Spirochaetota bacterium]|nr:host-nuclease inhibitor Gam family protein [Spirochaetota bacterium]